MNPRQRRAILLLTLSALGLIAVFALVASYVADVRAEVDPKIEVLALAQDAPANEGITDDMIDTLAIPERWAPKTALRDRGQVIGLVPASTLSKGSILQEGMLVASPELEQDQREIAILVDAETGVAGKVIPGSRVDIVGTFAADDDNRAKSEVVVEGARIIEVGQAQLKGSSGVTQPQGDPQQVVPVTFALTPREALRVTFAESFAQEVRLSLRRPGDRSPLDAPNETEFFRPPSRTAAP